VVYKTLKVGEYVSGLTAHNCTVVDSNVIDRITDHELGQMLNYQKFIGHPVGLILNFKRARLEWKRVINTTNRLQPRRDTDEATSHPRPSVVPLPLLLKLTL